MNSFIMVMSIGIKKFYLHRWINTKNTMIKTTHVVYIECLERITDQIQYQTIKKNYAGLQRLHLDNGIRWP